MSAVRGPRNPADFPGESSAEAADPELVRELMNDYASSSLRLCPPGQRSVLELVQTDKLVDTENAQEARQQQLLLGIAYTGFIVNSDLNTRVHSVGFKNYFYLLHGQFSKKNYRKLATTIDPVRQSHQRLFGAGSSLPPAINLWFPGRDGIVPSFKEVLKRRQSDVAEATHVPEAHYSVGNYFDELIYAFAVASKQDIQGLIRRQLGS